MIGISVNDSGALQACFGVSFAMKKWVCGILFATKYTKIRQTVSTRKPNLPYFQLSEKYFECLRVFSQLSLSEILFLQDNAVHLVIAFLG